MTRELERAIASQPDVLRRALQVDIDAAVERLRGCERVLLIGTGTSHHAAQLGALALARAGVDARSFAAAAYAHWPVDPRPSDGLVVISHTGETSFALAARERARAAGAPVVALTAQGAGWDGALEVAPREAAETYTQSYLASLLTLFRLAAALGASGSRRPAGGASRPGRGSAADPQPDAVLLPARLLVLVGAGPCAVTAAEGALKLREGARLPAEGYSAELLLHGSAVPLDERDALVLVGPELDPHGIVALVGEAARREGIARAPARDPRGARPAPVPAPVDGAGAAARAAAGAGARLRRRHGDHRRLGRARPVGRRRPAGLTVRVLVVDPQAFTPPYDHELCASLGARGHDVELLTTRFSHGEVPAPSGYRRREAFVPPAAGLVLRWPSSPLRVPLKLAGHLRGLATLAREARRERADIVHWQWAPLPKLDLRALRRIDRRAGATVFTAHDVLPRRSAGQVELWRALYGSCDRVIVHSERGRERLEREVGVDPARIAVVPHALFASLANWPTARGDGPPTILHFGLLRPDKGLDTLVEALPAVAAAVPEVRLEVVGSPRMPLGPLKERAAALGVADRIRWDERFVSDAELAAAFGRASVVALPYRVIESSGVLATTLAFGVPPVLTDVGAFPELCAAYDLGAPVPPDAPDALALALIAALTDESRRAAAIAGMARARAELTWERIAAQTEQVYRDALGA